jgi:hypothetical protein
MLANNFPTVIPSKINPSIINATEVSVVYTFTDKDITFDDDGNMLYKLPYSKNTFWTNFKYSVHGIKDNQTLQMGIKLVTTANPNNYDYYLSPQEARQPNTWYDTVWAIPSLKLENGVNSGGVYLKVDIPKDCIDNINFELKISLLGYINLFSEEVQNYILLTQYDTYHIIYCKDDIHNDNKPSITFYSPTREIRGPSQGIRLFTRY